MRCRGLDHVGLTVPDLDEAVKFFVAALDGEELYRYSREQDGDFMEQELGGARQGKFRLSMLRVPPDINIELFEWRVGSDRDAPALHSDPGGRHLALAVDDIVEARESLTRGTGATALGEIKTANKHPSLEGMRWIYVRTAFGLLIELIERPAGSGRRAI